MGFYILPAPGTKTGPCADACDHKDCAATRQLAATPCVHCGKPIGYDAGMRFQEDGGATGQRRMSHLGCDEQRDGRPRVRVSVGA